MTAVLVDSTIVVDFTVTVISFVEVCDDRCVPEPENGGPASTAVRTSDVDPSVLEDSGFRSGPGLSCRNCEPVDDELDPSANTPKTVTSMDTARKYSMMVVLESDGCGIELLCSALGWLLGSVVCCRMVRNKAR
jgi:hypothetical protein